MPRKVKILWVLCCLFIFFGFIYVSAKRGAQEMQEQARKTTGDSARQKGMERKTPDPEELEKMLLSKNIREIGELSALAKYAEAAKLAQAVVMEHPENAQAYTWWGISLVKLGKREEAIEKFTEAVKYDPNNPKTYLYWGLTLAMQEQFEEAISKYETAIKLDPESSNAYAYWGASLVGLRKYEEAIPKLQQAMNLNPHNELSYGFLIDSFYETRQFKEAWRIVFRSRNLNIKIPEASLERLALAMPEPTE